MCLAIPAKILSITGDSAVVDVQGVHRNVSLALLEKANLGDYVIAHAGFAIDILQETAAMEVLAYLREAGLRPPADDSGSMEDPSEP